MSSATTSEAWAEWEALEAQEARLRLREQFPQVPLRLHYLLDEQAHPGPGARERRHRREWRREETAPAAVAGPPGLHAALDLLPCDTEQTPASRVRRRHSRTWESGTESARRDPLPSDSHGGSGHHGPSH